MGRAAQDVLSPGCTSSARHSRFASASADGMENIRQEHRSGARRPAADGVRDRLRDGAPRLVAENHIIHRDLAARNVLVDSAVHCLVADFGLPRNLVSKQDYCELSTHSKFTAVSL